MASTRTFIRVVARLLELTQEGGLAWQRQDPPETFSPGPGERLEDGVVYTTEYLDKGRLRLYGLRLDPDGQGAAGSHAVGLEFVDEAGRATWRFPRVEGLDDLLEAVRFQTAGVKDFIDDFLPPPTLEGGEGQS
jgi:hypothetical protein